MDQTATKPDPLKPVMVEGAAPLCYIDLVLARPEKFYTKNVALLRNLHMASKLRSHERVADLEWWPHFATPPEHLGPDWRLPTLVELAFCLSGDAEPHGQTNVRLDTATDGVDLLLTRYEYLDIRSTKDSSLHRARMLVRPRI